MGVIPRVTSVLISSQTVVYIRPRVHITIDKMATPLNKNSKILIVGGGTWGNSTALHLARRGYTDVTVLDPNTMPSAISAGNDVNKIASEGEWSNCSCMG